MKVQLPYLLKTSAVGPEHDVGRRQTELSDDGTGEEKNLLELRCGKAGNIAGRGTEHDQQMQAVRRQRMVKGDALRIFRDDAKRKNAGEMRNQPADEPSGKGEAGEPQQKSLHGPFHSAFRSAGATYSVCWWV